MICLVYHTAKTQLLYTSTKAPPSHTLSLPSSDKHTDPAIELLIWVSLQSIGQRVRIESFTEGQAFSWSYDSAPRPPPLPPSLIGKFDRRHTGRLRKRDYLLKGEVGGKGWARSRPQESLVLYKSFNTLCYVAMFYTSRTREEGRRGILVELLVILTQRPPPDFLRLQVVGLEPDVL
jgi:hypothetical protein